MGQEDYRRLNNVEDRTYQGRRNPLKLHSKLKCQKISRLQREKIWYLLYVRNDGRSFRNEKATVDIILHQAMGQSQGDHGVPTLLMNSTDQKKKEVLLKLWTHRSTSFSKHSRYGREGLSSMVGKRCLPTTRSISSWTFLNSCGWRTMARRKVCKDAIVFQGGISVSNTWIFWTFLLYPLPLGGSCDSCSITTWSGRRYESYQQIVFQPTLWYPLHHQAQ